MAAVAALVAAGLPGSRRSVALAAPTTIEDLISAWLVERERKTAQPLNPAGRP